MSVSTNSQIYANEISIIPSSESQDIVLAGGFSLTGTTENVGNIILMGGQNLLGTNVGGVIIGNDSVTPPSNGLFVSGASIFDGGLTVGPNQKILGSNSGSINTEMDLSNGIAVYISEDGATGSTLFLNTASTTTRPSEFLIQGYDKNKILENLTQTGLFLNNLAITTEVSSIQSLVETSVTNPFTGMTTSSYSLPITFPFTSLLQVNSGSQQYSYVGQFNLSLTDLPFTEYIFNPNTSAGNSGESITVVLLMNFGGYANSFTLNYSNYPNSINIPVPQIYSSLSSQPSIVQNSNEQLFQTVTIFYNPSNSTSSSPLYDSASYSVIVDYSLLYGSLYNAYTQLTN